MKREYLSDLFPNNPDAVRLLVDIWEVMQVWDDAYDGDPANHHEGYKTALIRLPNNPLYYSCQVPFLVAQCFYDWMTANGYEKAGIQFHKAYMLRAGYYRIILSLIHLIRGPEVAEKIAPKIWGFYGESFSEYIEEFTPCPAVAQTMQPRRRKQPQERK